MGEEAYDETRFVTDSGTIIVRGGYSREDVWLGLSPGQNHDDDPDVVVKLGPGLQRRLCAALGEMETTRCDLLNEKIRDAVELLSLHVGVLGSLSETLQEEADSMQALQDELEAAS